MSKKAVIYSKENCPFCVKAKKILTEQGIPYEEKLYQSPDFPSKQYLEEKLGVTVNTVPQILLDEGDGLKYVGGCDKLMAKFGVQ